jgi:replicative DNA helicase
MVDTHSPHDLDAEQVVLGAALMDSSVMVAVDLRPEDFYRPAHALLWEHLTDAYVNGDPIDPVAIAGRLVDAGDANRVGGAAYLHTLVAAVPTTANAGYYAEKVREQARRRNLVVVRDRIDQLTESGADADTTVALVREWLDDSTDNGTWPDPLPLTAQQHRLPGFPVEALPDWLSAHVLAVAEFNQVPADLPACLALACLSTAAGGKLLLEIKPGWLEPVNLFTVIAMPPGTRKTPVFRAMVKPLRDAEKQLCELAAPRIIEARTALKAAQQAADKAAARVTPGCSAETMAEAVGAAMNAEQISIPPKPQLIADDETPENAASIMADQGGRIAILAPEGGIIGTIAGRYSGAPNFDIFLRGHGGDDLKVGRKTRDREEIERAALTLGLCLQPGVLRELHKIPGAADKGLLARILYALPADNVGYRKTNPDPVPAEVAHAYDANLRALTMSLADLHEPASVPFSAVAAGIMGELGAEIEPRLRPTGEWAHIREWGNKYVGSVVGRIAGLLHVAEHLRDGWGQPLSPETLGRAVRIGQYFATHALAAFDAMGTDPMTGHAQAALSWIERTRPERFTKRELFSAIYRGRFTKADELDPVLDLLEQHGYVRRLPDPERRGRGRKPSPRYVVHPRLSKPSLRVVSTDSSAVGAS